MDGQPDLRFRFTFPFQNVLAENHFVPKHFVSNHTPIGLSQHASENACRRPHAATLQQVDEFPQAALIVAVSHSVRKGPFHALANRTKRLPVRRSRNLRRKHPLAAGGTQLAVDRKDLLQTLGAHRKP
jgi:hypothetical protein